MRYAINVCTCSGCTTFRHRKRALWIAAVVLITAGISLAVMVVKVAR